MHLCRVAAALALVAATSCEPDVAPPPAPLPGVTALFDPTATPPVVPTPTDLAFVGGDGVHLNVPDLPTDSPAQRALNAFLRTLTGFPAASTAMAHFSGPIDPASATVQTPNSPGSIVVVDTTAGVLVDASAHVAGDGTELDITPASRFAPGHRYAILLFGGVDPIGLRPAMGGVVLASPVFFFLRSPNPLIARCGDPTNPACVCPAAAVADPNDTSCHSVVRGLSDAQARQAEPQRAQLDAALSQILPLAAPNHMRTDLVLFWSFTITTQAMAVFDPASGSIPFPNDALIDPMTGRVTLPIAPGDPQAALKMQLNTLDGFSTSAAETLPVDAPAGATADAASLVPGMTTLMLNLDPTPGAEQPSFVAVGSDGQIVLQPRSALVPDQRRYAVAVTRAVTVGGQPLLPSPTTVLELQSSPLFDGTHSTVTQLTDAQAQQLEALRLALQPLVAALGQRGLSPSALAALWTFTTQSIVRPLAAADAFPTLAMLPTDVTATVYTDFTTLPAALQPLVADVRAVVLGSFTTLLVYDPTTRAVTFTRMPLASMPTVPQADVFVLQPPASAMTATVRFWLTIPKTSPGGAARVIIVQHGLASWRGDVFSLGEDFAKGGAAAFGFDIDFHGSRTRCATAADCMPASTTDDPAACILAAFSGNTMNDCKPAASGQGYVDASNLFGARSGGWQYVVDGAQVLRVVRATGGHSLAATLAGAGLANAIDPSRVSFIGQSLGGIDGSLLLAADPTLVGAHVLNVAGGHLFEIFADSPTLHGVVDTLLMQLGITRGTPAYAQLVQTARWVLDPIDPFSTARFIRRAPALSYLTMMRNAPKLAIVQEAGMDTVIPPANEAALSSEIWFPMGLDAAGHAQGANAHGAFVSTFFADAVHGTLLTAMPSPAMRVQAVTYVLSAGDALPAP